MAQNTFEKTMRNRTLSNEGRGARPEHNGRENWTLRVDIEPTDKSLLRTAFNQELSFYNGLVQGLSTRLRAFPEVLLTFTGQWEELFADLAQTGVNVNRVRSPDQLTGPLTKHRDLLFNKEGRPQPIPERIGLILELASISGAILPEVRRAMALEMMRFYRAQAQASSNTMPTHQQEEQLYKQAHENLEIADHVRKRHVQLPRAAVKMTYDEESHRTDFRLPYIRNPISVSGNFTHANSWNLLLVKQAGEGMPNSKTPWLIELRKTPHQYLVKLLDTINPYRGNAFNVAKTARSAV
jgi:hypothetical protein